MTTTIEWCDEVWNCVVGCSRVSDGCRNCYAERVAHRNLAPQHRGLTTIRGGRPGWTGEVRTVPDLLSRPLRWRKPRRVFVNSMSDLFHESVPFEFVAAVYGVMLAAARHTFLVLTKRPARALEFFQWATRTFGGLDSTALFCRGVAMDFGIPLRAEVLAWPPPNVHLGVSAEHQAAANERIPLLLECPAAVRWVSYEPALGPVDFRRWLPKPAVLTVLDESLRAVPAFAKDGPVLLRAGPCLDWIVVGGESGPGARQCDRKWIESTVRQCRGGGTPVFVKQLGSHYCDPENGIGGVLARPDPTVVPPLVGRLVDRKGADVAEWPESLRVREFPEVRRA